MSQALEVPINFALAILRTMDAIDPDPAFVYRHYDLNQELVLFANGSDVTKTLAAAIYHDMGLVITKNISPRIFRGIFLSSQSKTNHECMRLLHSQDVDWFELYAATDDSDRAILLQARYSRPRSPKLLAISAVYDPTQTGRFNHLFQA